MQTIHLKPKEQRRLLKGHLWVFSNELQAVPGDIAAKPYVSSPMTTGLSVQDSIIRTRSSLSASFPAAVKYLTESFSKRK